MRAPVISAGLVKLVHTRALERPRRGKTAAGSSAQRLCARAERASLRSEATAALTRADSSVRSPPWIEAASGGTERNAKASVIVQLPRGRALPR